ESSVAAVERQLAQVLFARPVARPLDDWGRGPGGFPPEEGLDGCGGVGPLAFRPTEPKRAAKILARLPGAFRRRQPPQAQPPPGGLLLRGWNTWTPKGSLGAPVTPRALW